MYLHQITYHILVSATLITYVYLLPKYKTCLVVTNTDNNHKFPKTTTNNHKPSTNGQKSPSNNHKQPQTTKKQPPINDQIDLFRIPPNYFTFLQIGNDAEFERCHINH